MTETATSPPSGHDAEQTIRDMITTVWVRGDLDALRDFWTSDCVNHASTAGAQVGLAALRDYHAAFATQLAGFSNPTIEIVQQVSDGERVVTHLFTHADHTGDFAGAPATGLRVRLETIRIDRMSDDKIAEHWSVADVAGLIRQLQA